MIIDGERIATLDIVRGVAVCGILAMNIVAFAMPEAAYQNPAAYGGHNGLDGAVWAFNFVLIDSKMRGLFSFLFGASMLLVIERATARGEDAARVHFGRMFWLFVIGMAHLLLVWWGDILQHYALVGALAWFLRRQPVPQLLALGITLVIMETVFVAALPYSVHAAEVAAQTAHPAPAVLQTLADYQAGFGRPSPGAIATDLAQHRGSYATIVAARYHDEIGSPLSALIFVGMETLAFMLFGMAGLRSGMLTGAWDDTTYRRIALWGFAVSIPAYAALAFYVWMQGFSLFSVALATIVLAAPLRPAMIVAWASLIILLSRQARNTWSRSLVSRFAAAGRMAFSNYLGTSLICTTLFYGYGLGWYGRFSRAELYLVVFAGWALMLAWSRLWLALFNYGPAEWVWRSLSRGQVQRFVRR